MARTSQNLGADGFAGSMTRGLLNTTTAGSAVIAKVLLGAGLAMTSTGVDAGTGDVTLSATPPAGYLFGLGLSNDGTTPATVIDVAAGSAADSTNAALITLASAFTKKINAAWTAGTGNGGLDTGTVAASKWYHLFVIRNAAGTLNDVLISLSATTPTMPSGYTLFRRIGSIYYSATPAIRPFTQNGSEFYWTVPVSGDILNGGTLALNTATLYTAVVPTGVKVNALVGVQLTANSANTHFAVCSPDATPPVIGPDTVALVPASSYGWALINERTNTSGQFTGLANVALTSLTLSTKGWIDTRGMGVISGGGGGGGSGASTTIASNTLPTSTAAYTLALTDAGSVVEATDASAVTVTVPLNATVAFPVGTVIELHQYGTGQITLAPISGVTLRSSSSLTTRVQYSTLGIRQRAINEWIVSGDVS